MIATTKKHIHSSSWRISLAINEVLVNDEDHVNHMPVAEERKNLDFTLTAYNFRVYLKQ